MTQLVTAILTSETFPSDRTRRHSDAQGPWLMCMRAVLSSFYVSFVGNLYFWYQ